MKIGIIGVGVVGTAILEGFKQVDSKYNSYIGYDKYKNIGSLEEIILTDICFICVPTQFSYKSNSYNKNEIHNVLQQLVDYNYSGIVILKCTVEPLVTEELASQYKLKLIHSPEFLSATSNIQDFVNQHHIVIGTTNNVTDSDIDKVKLLFTTTFPNAHLSINSSNESECMKIFVNNFYSVKIQFFNELYLLCNNIKVDFNKVKDLMLKNNWINPMHTDVPGSDGKLSYGGMCFPKDTNALLEFMKNNNSPNKVLDACINERNTMRNDHINIQDLEK